MALELRSLCHTTVPKVKNELDANSLPRLEVPLKEKPVREAVIAHFKLINALQLCGLNIMHEGIR